MCNCKWQSRIGAVGFNTRQPTSLLAYISRALLPISFSDRTQAKAKAAGKYKGRAPTAMAKADEVLTLLKGGMGATEVARKLGIGRASVYRILEAVTPK